MNIRVKLGLSLLSALLLLLGVGYISEKEPNPSAKGFDWITPTDEILPEIQALSALAAVENTERRYMPSGDEEPRNAFRYVRKQFMSRFTCLRALTQNYPRQQQRVNSIPPILLPVLAVPRGVMHARGSNLQKLADHTSLALATDGTIIEQIQNYFEKMRTEEQELHQGRLRASQISSLRSTTTIVDLGIGLAVIVVLLSGFVVARALKSREKGQPALLEEQGLEARARESTANLSNISGQYRLLFEASPLAMVMFDVQTHSFLAVNAAAEELCGYTREEFLAMTRRESQPREESPLLMEILDTTTAAESYKAMFTTQQKKGQLLTLEARVHTIDWGGRKSRLALLTDVTEQKRLETQLQQSQKMEALGRLAGGVAHDFNNLLTVVLAYSSLILRKLDGNNPLHHKISEVHAAGQRAAKLTSQLLAFSRKQILSPQILDLNAVVSKISQTLRRLLGDDIKVLLDLDSDLGRVRADPTQLEQILINLAVNARDAMPHGGLLTIRTHNSELDNSSNSSAGIPPGRYVVLTVTDTGCGMDESTRIRVFEPFLTSKAASKGTGLGLATVLGVVQQSGGTVTVHSELGFGTTFRIYLPRLDDDTRAADEPRELKSLAFGVGQTILLADDESQVRSQALWCCEVLAGQSWRLTTV